MNIINLEQILKNEPKYRLKQIKEATFKQLASDWSEALSIPAKLRTVLEKEFSLKIDGDIVNSDSDKNVHKAIITLEDGLRIESVLMEHVDGRATVCVSSQVGCPMGCRFCATGAAGFRRNLTADEIISQVVFFARYLKTKGDKKITNIVFMGMGEPFLNYDNVMRAVKIFNDDDGLNIGARKISISTSGIVEGINNLAKESLQVNLAVSLHATNDELRSELMPVNNLHSLEVLFQAIDNYIKQTSRQVMFEYILLADANDSEEDARALVHLMKKPLYFVNLIIYNPIGKKGMHPSSSESVKKFKEILKKSNIPFSQRHRFGRNIKAACGQLATLKKGK